MSGNKLWSEEVSLLNDLGVGVVLIDTQTQKIEAVNLEMLNLSLYEEDEFLQKSFVEFFSKKSRVRVQALFNIETVKEMTSVSEKNAILRKRDGSPLYVSLSLKSLEQGSKKLITVINVEPRRELEIKLEQVYAQMIQTSKFMSLAEMAGGIAHEINNPLAIVHSYAEQMKILAEKELLDSDKVLKISEKMTHAVMRASKIIDSLKKLSRREEENQFSTVLMSDIVDEALELCSERFAGYGIELVIHNLNSDLKVLCHSSQILQVLLNLLENALHATKEAETRRVELQIEKISDKVRVSVNDSGPGVPPQLQNDIMNPFFTTKDVNEGTGLGLSISRTIIEQHHGVLYYDSLQKGASFNFELPLAEVDQGAQKRELSVSLNEKSLKMKSKGTMKLPFIEEDFKVLVVDDEVDLTEAVCFGLESKGYSVLKAHNGSEALQIMKQEEVDVVLSDIRMPQLGGLELLKGIKSELSYFPKIFFVTGSTCLPIDKYFSEGVEGFFYKPVSIFKILETIKESLLPKQKYLERERLRYHFDKNYSLGLSGQEGPSIGNIGKGGMFVEDQGDLPKVGDAIEFSLELQGETGQIQVKGTGLVRWVRNRHGESKKRGFGMEFYRIEGNGANDLFHFLDGLQTKAFIPLS